MTDPDDGEFLDDPTHVETNTLPESDGTSSKENTLAGARNLLGSFSQHSRAESESLALDHDSRETTPKPYPCCRECGVEVVEIGPWRPPETADIAWGVAREGEDPGIEAWRRRACHVSTPTAKSSEDSIPLQALPQAWSFCPSTGIAWIGGVRRNFERRRRDSVPLWAGRERRHG